MAAPEQQRMPTQAEVLEMIDALTDITEEEKETLRRDVLRSGGVTGNAASPELAIVFVLFLIIAAVIGGLAFVLIVRERARVNQKRQRQQRQKKKKKAVKGK